MELLIYYSISFDYISICTPSQTVDSGIFLKSFDAQIRFTSNLFGSAASLLPLLLYVI